MESPFQYPLDLVELLDGLDEEADWPVPTDSVEELGLVGALGPASSTPVQSPRFLPVKDTSIVIAGPSLHQARATSGRSSTRPFKGLTKRKNRKEQINELCALAAALTQQIQLLKSPPFSSSITSAGEQQHSWERIATRQHKLRLKAEEQNAALLRIKKIQQREIKNFKRMFRRRIDEELMGNRLLLRRPKHVHELVDNSRIFADLLRHSDKLYASVDQIFQEKGMDKVPCPGRTCQIPQHSTTGTLAEFLDKNLVPFSVQQAARAVWRCLRRRKIPDADHVYAEDYQQNEDTTTSYVHFVCSVGGTVAYIQEHGAARKFVEENRTMIVSQMTSEPAGMEIGSFGGLRYREEMSVVVRCGAPLASGQETAIIETYLVVFQSDQGSQAAMAFRAPGILDLAIKGWDSKVALRKQEIENLLFI